MIAVLIVCWPLVQIYHRRPRLGGWREELKAFWGLMREVAPRLRGLGWGKDFASSKFHRWAKPLQGLGGDKDLTSSCTLDGNIQEESGAATITGARAIWIREGWQLASLKNNREVMVSTVGVKQSLPSSTLTFPFLCPTNKIL
jgi:hypothetical protein